MAKGRSTLKELAQALDLSIATVSRALGGYEDIAQQTRERVAAKARELGYVPNSAGRSLVSGRSGFVGLVLPIRGPDFVDSFLGEFITGLGEGLVAHGSDLLLVTAPQGQSELGVLEHLVRSGRADGVVLTRIAEDDARLTLLYERGFPFVAHGRLLNSAHHYHWLDTDGAAAFTHAFDMLYELGHRHFGLVTIEEPMTFRYDRERGLTEAITRRGDPSVTLKVARAPRFDASARSAAIAAMFEAGERPTAVLGLFDELALAALRHAASNGLSIPHDLSVIGFDNIAAAEFAPPGLTTFDQSTRDSARTIASMLHRVIEETPKEPVTHLKTARFIARGSHGPAPAESHR